MADGKIRVKSQAEYIIEVNDQGETISFDLTDTGLVSKLFKMYEAIDKFTAQMAEKAKEIDARADESLQTIDEDDPETGETRKRVLLTKNQYDGAQLIDSFYSEARTAVDKFLGQGACRKIFGDKNYENMFDDLLEQLQPHFKKIGLKATDIRHSAAAKHAPNRAQRRALK